MVALRAAPDADAPVICSFYSGVGFDLLAYVDDWVAVRVDGIPGLPPLPEVQDAYGHGYQPVGYLAKTDVCEVDSIAAEYLVDLLPTGRSTGASDKTLILLSAAEEDAPLQVVAMPDETYRIFGAHNGFYLVQSSSVFGYVSQEHIITDAHSAKLPGEVLWARPDYYADAPLTFALVNPPEDDGTVALYRIPSAGEPPLATYPFGTVVQLLDKEPGLPYYRVRTVDREGYMERALLQVDGEPGKPTLTGIRSMRAYTSGEEFDLRSFPDEHAPVSNVQDGLYLSVLGLAGDWFLVRYTTWAWDGQWYQGYVRPTAATDFAVGMDLPSAYECGILILPDGLERTPLYAEPSTDAEVLGRYFHTTQVELPEATSPYEWWGQGFVRVLVDGKEGYFIDEHVQPLTRYNDSAF